MNKFIADTMALILRLENRTMPANVKEKFEDAEKDKAVIYIPAIVLAELSYLSERKRIETTLEAALSYIKKYNNISELPMSVANVQSAFEIDDIPELHDRLIAGAGKESDIPILTNDQAMQNSRHVM